jgi:hypothetical protein
MTAGEDEPQPVIGDAAHVGLVAAERFEFAEPRERFGLLRAYSLAPQPIDGPISCRGDDPRSRILRDAARRPGAKSVEECLLYRLFSKIEVAEDADKGRDRPSLLLPEQAVDDPACLSS